MMKTLKQQTRSDPLSIRVAGYTLVELMIVVIILGILASAALPAYSAYTESSRRHQATNQLYRVTLSLERFYGERMTYEATLAELELPETDSMYQYRVENSHRKAYQVTATPRPGNLFRTAFRINHYGLQQHLPPGQSNWQNGWKN